MAEIINNSKILKKLKTKIKSIVGPTRLVRESDVLKMAYLQACVKEVLRVHPSSPFTHMQSSKDCKINNYEIEAQTRKFINVYAIMRDLQLCVNLEEYIPERFLESGDEMNDGDEYDDKYNQFLSNTQFELLTHSSDSTTITT
ncbi:hypothetical protein RYX36_021375 [Vicia faba]